MKKNTNKNIYYFGQRSKNLKIKYLIRKVWQK